MIHILYAVCKANETMTFPTSPKLLFSPSQTVTRQAPTPAQPRRRQRSAAGFQPPAESKHPPAPVNESKKKLRKHSDGQSDANREAVDPARVPPQHIPNVLPRLGVPHPDTAVCRPAPGGCHPPHPASALTTRACPAAAQGWQGRGGARGAGRQKVAPPAVARGAAKFRGR